MGKMLVLRGRWWWWWRSKMVIFISVCSGCYNKQTNKKTDWGALNSRNSLSTIVEAENLRQWQDWLAGAPLLAHLVLLPLTWSFLCVCVQIPSSYKHTSHIGLSPP